MGQARDRAASVLLAAIAHEHRKARALLDETPWHDAERLSAEGEQEKLAERVPLVDGVEQWLKHLHHSIHRSLNHLLHKLMKDVLGGMPPEEWPNKVSLSLLLMFELENSKNVFWFVDSRKLLHYIVSKTHECLLRYEYCACGSF